MIDRTRRRLAAGAGLGGIASGLGLVARPARAADTPGVTATAIRLGGTVPYSGPASSLGGMGLVQSATFKMINERGGINGRRIEFLSLDDGYSPPKTVEQTRKLVEQEEVAAIFGSLGTAPNAAIQRYLNTRKVPQLFIATGADRWSNTPDFPWTLSFQPSYRMEARAYARHFSSTMPSARLALLFQNDDFGRDFVAGLKDEFGERYGQVVVEASYEVTDPTVDSQIVALKNSGAQAILIAGLPKSNAQALRKIHDSGWKPLLFISATGSQVATVMKPTGPERSIGAISANFLKDPVDPEWKDDPGMNEYRAFMRSYVPGADASELAHMVGYGQALTMAQVLRQCGQDLSRDNILRQANALKEFPLPVLVPGITVNTAVHGPRAVAQLQLARWNGESWKRFGDVVSIGN